MITPTLFEIIALRDWLRSKCSHISRNTGILLASMLMCTVMFFVITSFFWYLVATLALLGAVELLLLAVLVRSTRRDTKE